jgi:hypothetical protein
MWYVVINELKRRQLAENGGPEYASKNLSDNVIHSGNSRLVLAVLLD